MARNHGTLRQAEERHIGRRPFQGIGVAEVGRPALLHQVSREHDPGVGHDHHDVVVRVGPAEVTKLHRPAAQIDGGRAVEGSGGRDDPNFGDLFCEVWHLPGHVLLRALAPSLECGDAPFVSPDGRRCEHGVTKRVVEVMVGVHHEPGSRGQPSDVVLDLPALPVGGARVDHQGGVVPDHQADILVEELVATDEDPGPELLPVAAASHPRSLSP